MPADDNLPEPGVLSEDAVAELDMMRAMYAGEDELSVRFHRDHTTLSFALTGPPGVGGGRVGDGVQRRGQSLGPRHAAGGATSRRALGPSGTAGRREAGRRARRPGGVRDPGAREESRFSRKGHGRSSFGLLGVGEGTRCE